MPNSRTFKLSNLTNYLTTLENNRLGLSRDFFHLIRRGHREQFLTESEGMQLLDETAHPTPATEEDRAEILTLTRLYGDLITTPALTKFFTFDEFSAQAAKAHALRSAFDETVALTRMAPSNEADSLGTDAREAYYDHVRNTLPQLLDVANYDQRYSDESLAGPFLSFSATTEHAIATDSPTFTSIDIREVGASILTEAQELQAQIGPNATTHHEILAQTQRLSETAWTTIQDTFTTLANELNKDPQLATEFTAQGGIPAAIRGDDLTLVLPKEIPLPQILERLQATQQQLQQFERQHPIRVTLAHTHRIDQDYSRLEKIKRNIEVNHLVEVKGIAIGKLFDDLQQELGIPLVVEVSDELPEAVAFRLVYPLPDESNVGETPWTPFTHDLDLSQVNALKDLIRNRVYATNN